MNLELTSNDVRQIVHRVNRLIDDGTYSSAVLALLVGNDCNAPTIVPVPINPEVRVWSSVDELDVRMYVYTSDEPGVKECGLNRYHVNRFPPYAVTSLKYAYTFYFESPTTPTASNFLMQSKMRRFGYLPLPQLHGNVLVVKHNRQGVVAMETKDWPLIKVILEWLIDNRVHYADVKPPLFQTPKLLVRPVRWAESLEVNDTASLDTNVIEPGSLMDDEDGETADTIQAGHSSSQAEVTEPITDIVRAESMPSDPVFAEGLEHLPVPVPPSGPAIHQMFWQNLDLRWTMFENSGILSLFELSRTSTTMRAWVEEFYQARVGRMLSKAFDVKVHADVMDTLDEYDGRFVGSAAYCVADPRASIDINDINVVVPYGSGQSFCKALIQLYHCKGRAVSKDNLIRDRFDNWVENFYVLKSPEGINLTISESMKSSILPLTLAGYSTAECVLLGRSKFTLLFPTLVERGDVLSMHTMGYTIPAETADLLRRRWRFMESTDEMDYPCEEACPRKQPSTIGDE
ncbi:hypothetical protein EV360DRAFT_80164 [Lentinula raphanica]|nr:hypothetical protein EV360DRAFT_80164 [Lentinula raphanica]